MGNDHGHSGHGADASNAHDSHGDAHGGGHGDGAPDFPFGEVIPEKNWQESVLVVFCMVVLVGFVWLFMQWVSIPIPAVVAEGGDEVNAQRSEHTVKGESNVQVIDVPKADTGTTNSPEGHAETVNPAQTPQSPVASPAAAPAVQAVPNGSTK
jgi:hypothetical protein